MLYHRLVLDRSQGKYDPERFLEYLKLPKHVVYIQPKYMEPIERRQPRPTCSRIFRRRPCCRPSATTSRWCAATCSTFLLDAARLQVISRPTSAIEYLKQLFAETKIVNGLGDAEKLYCDAAPGDVPAAKERIDLDFAYTNKTELAADDPVGLDLYVKNVDTLIVKVFEVNTQNFYRQNLHEIGPDINLDGLVANDEKTYTYKEPPLRRVRRHFEFSTLNRRGVYVIDFIGNGKASRA